MGQYYKPISLDKRKRTVKGFLRSWDYQNGSKLMEHSWIGNDFMLVVESLLIPGGQWYMTPIVWAGDYADHEKGGATNLYSRAKDTTGKKTIPDFEVTDEFEYRFILNHTKKMYVDKKDVPRCDWDKTFRIHPLPLLTCEGNGRGGGDYHGEEEIVGSWARDIISMEREIPKAYAGYTKLIFKLKE